MNYFKIMTRTLQLRSLFSFYLIVSLFAEVKAQSTTHYTNPILAGFYPDPSITRVGDDYYIVNSSFAYYPGLPLFHSKDLVSWKQIGHAMNRPEQLDLIGAGVSRGLFAPSISYHKGVYYIVCTLIDKGGNFVITAKNPAGPWSNPVWLKEVDGIDPSLFFDDNDKAYLLYNSIPPDNKSLWDGHRTIRMRSFDYHQLKVLDDERILVNGGVDISKKPVWIEGPHIYKVNGWYYLLCAEGGTGYNHSAVIFKSQFLSEFKPYEKNPILTQRHLNKNRKHPITTVGHADLVETPEGKWHAVFLGCRPYEGAHFNTGRETFLAPVQWKDGWPVITEGEELVRYSYPLPLPKNTQKPTSAFSSNFTYINDFSSPVLDQRFTFLRTVTANWYNTTEKKGFLTLQLQPETVSGTGNPSFVGHRQQHLIGEASTTVNFKPAAENEKAGLIIFQNENHFYYVCQSIANSKPVVQLYRSTPTKEMELLATRSILTGNQPISFKIRAKGSTYDFLFSTGREKWQLLKSNVDAKFLSTETAGGFVGAVFGMYATSLGKASNTKAYFDGFIYKGMDEMYSQ